MKVALVTNWGEKCGIAEYAANLAAYARKHSNIDLKIVDRPLTFEHIYQETREVDVIHFNCALPEFRSLFTETWPWPRFKEGNKSLTLNLHDSSQAKIRKIASLVCKNEQGRWVPVFDRVATHEACIGESYPTNVCVIPHGLHVEDVSDIPVQQKIGTAGFPMPWKGHIPAAIAASNLNLGYLSIMPKSHHIDVAPTKKLILHYQSKAEVVTEWLSQKEVIRRLAECFVNVFPYELEWKGWKDYEFNGISGAVRFGLSAQRPVIVSRCWLFRDLWEYYPDEVYFMDNGLEQAIVRVLHDYQNGKVKRPKKILEDMNWSRCACMYLEMWSYVGNHWIVGMRDEELVKQKGA